MDPCFSFLHVGTDSGIPTMLVRSLRAVHPRARILHCADLATPQVEGSSEVFRLAGDTANLMTFRLQSFAALGLDTPAAYVDTDMICLRQMDPATLLGDADAAVCARDTDCEAAFNPSFRGMDLHEYSGRRLGDVYPWLACFTLTKDARFWAACLDALQKMDPKFHQWYGDQEALRAVVADGRFRVGRLPEKDFACLPDRRPMHSAQAYMLHFKGAARKQLMRETARSLRLAD